MELRNKYANIDQEESMSGILLDENVCNYIYNVLFSRCILNGQRLIYPDTFENNPNVEQEYMEIIKLVVETNLPLYATAEVKKLAAVKPVKKLEIVK